MARLWEGLGWYNGFMWYALTIALGICVILATRANRGQRRSSRAAREMRDYMRRQSYRNDESA
jgi:hypothetical protein